MKISKLTSSNKANISRTVVRFIIKGIGQAEGEFRRHLAPRTVNAIIRNLPIEGRAAIRMEQVYFEIPVKMGTEKGKTTVEEGTVAFWPMGSALCVFFGKTQPYGMVNVIGRITKNIELFRRIRSGNTIKVERA